MNNNVKNLTAGALFIAMAVVLPLFFHVFSQTAGIVFSPLQLPVLLAAVFLPIRYAALVGLLSPLLSSLLTGMPPLLPMAPLMSAECLTYAVVLRWLLGKNNNIFTALLVAMVAGRIVYVLANTLFFAGFAGAGGMMAALIVSMNKSWAAILLQLIVVPAAKKIAGSRGAALPATNIKVSAEKRTGAETEKKLTNRKGKIAKSKKTKR